MSRFLGIALMLLLFSCKTQKSVPAAASQKAEGKGTSSGLDQRIKTFTATAPCPDASVKEMEFKGKLVYVFEPGTCARDMESKVLDAKGNELGMLGGLMGNTRIQGEDFSSARVLREVWRKDSGN